MHKLSLLLAVISLLATSAMFACAADKPPGDPSLNPKYQFLGLWQGPTGIGTCILISPSWIMTAGHVGGPKAKDPTRHIDISFDNGTKAVVAEAFLASVGDLAIARISPPVRNIAPARLLDRSFSKDEGDIFFTMAGHSGGMHVHPGRHGKAMSDLHFRMINSPEDPSPGRGGDSGGAWAVDSPDDHLPIVFAVIHGGGLANQVGAYHEWLEKTMGPTSELPQWKSWTKPTTQPDN